ncbi:MAG TPA: glycosyl hydrolase family 8 [Candidatus Kapabacteria bacterium]|nr:glycosyl hydrolase family 8 [Candidatus Kapabacteria bacterium]
MFDTIKAFFQTHLFEGKRDRVLILLLVAATVFHVVNMFGYPTYREDEGTYMSQSWAVLNMNTLAPYTYWYDHSPAGWIFLSVWNFLNGDFFRHGLAVNSGRIFMAILQIFSTYFVYRIAKNITERRDAAVVATLIFSVSPLAIIFHRHVLLDNIMTFWFLLSILLLSQSFRLKNIVLSALTFALAVLSKESAIVFFPVMLGIVAYHTHKNHRHFAVVVWLSVAVLTMSLYPVFALLKGELFPSGTFLGGSQPHVSLWEAIQFQTQRSDDIAFWKAGSTFRHALDTTWMRYGTLLILVGLLSMVAQLCMYKKKWHFAIGMMTLLFTIYIMRGQVLDWYIIPVIPLFSLSIAMVYAEIIRLFSEEPSYEPKVRTGLGSVIAAILLFNLGYNYHIFTLDLTTNQVEAVAWTKEHILPKDAVVLIDNYAFVDLNPHIEDITKTKVHYYWKVDTDPMVKDTILHADWNSIDYMLTTPALAQSIYDDDLTIVKEAFEKSHVVKRFSKYEEWFEGYPVEIREVNNKNGTVHKSWQWYKENFITDSGQVIDKSSNNQTTSEGQSYALLRAVWEDDQETFDTVLDWTMTHLKLSDAYLFAWLAHGEEEGALKIKDYTTASDADEDIALALIFAHKKWGGDTYLPTAQAIIRDIWQHEIVHVNNTYYLIAGTNLERDGGYLVNPSYFSPASYRIFADVDKAHPWEKVADDTYRILHALNKSPVFNNKNTALVPNWFIVDKQGKFRSTGPYIQATADYYGYDAFRLYWRIALDKTWFDSNDAAEYLEQVTPFFKKEWEEKKQINSVYLLDGTPGVSYDDISTDAGALSVFFITEPELAIDMYSTNFWPKYKDGYWGDPNKYYDQNWAWFATALYTHNTPNLWGMPESLAKK